MSVTTAGEASAVIDEAEESTAVADVEPAAPDATAAAVVADAAPAKRRRAPRSETRIADEAAFVLHSYPYKETSLVIDVLTRHYGRVGLVARGAKRPRSMLRGVLLAFQPLALSWTQARARAVTAAASTSDLRTLTRAEWLGGQKPLRGEALMSGFYLNELIQKLLARDDPHERLFDAYVETLAALADDRPAAPLLRNFEMVLLREAGYAVHATQTIDGKTVDPAGRYRYLPERGPMRVDDDTDAVADGDTFVSGKTLLDLERDDYTDPVTLAQSKRLMRYLLSYHLSGQVLQTRRLVLDLQSLEEGMAR